MVVLFFDGECLLCSKGVGLITRYNTAKNIRFASLKSEYAKKVLEPALLKAETLVFRNEDQYFVRSVAVFELLRHLPAWRWLRLLRFLPAQFTDKIYKWVAGNRYYWFGRQEECAMISPETRQRFVEATPGDLQT